MHWSARLAAGLVALTVSRSLLAEGGSSGASPQGQAAGNRGKEAPAEESAPRGAPLAPGEVRTLPDYDSRGSAERGGPAALWVPRVLLFPAYVVTEYGIRQPIGYAVRGAERAGFAELFASSSDYKLFPTVVVDFGFRTSIGVYAGVNNLWVKGHEVRLRVAYGGGGFLKVKFKDRYVFEGKRQRLGVIGSYRERADDTYGGLGPDIRYNLDRVGRFSTRVTEGGVRYEYGLESPTNFTLDGLVRDVRFGSKSCCGPALVDQIARGQIAAPPGFGEGFLGIHEQIVGSVDTRRALTSRGPWARAEVQFGADVSLRNPGSQRWTNFGVELGGGFSLPELNQRIQLSVAGLFAEQLARDPIPLTGLVHLGGEQYLRGFGDGALYGQSALVATLKYSWPVWLLLDGTFHVAAGNTFGPHLRGFEPDKLRLSFGPGLSTSVIDENKLLDFLVAFGSDTFEQGARISSIRVTVGLTEGF
jgi:hypothetical protein